MTTNAAGARIVSCVRVLVIDRLKTHELDQCPSASSLHMFVLPCCFATFQRAEDTIRYIVHKSASNASIARAARAYSASASAKAKVAAAPGAGGIPGDRVKMKMQVAAIAGVISLPKLYLVRTCV